jgi:exonuclease III
VRLLTWNLNARWRQLPEQLAALAERAPDIVALQEVTARTAPRLRIGLQDLGLVNVLDSFAVSPPWQAVGPRRYALIMASRLSLAPRPSEASAPWPERILSAKASTAGGPLVIHTTHVRPGSSNGWMKIEMLEGVLAAVAAAHPSPQILCGDFNVPQHETAEGTIVTWAQRIGSNEVISMRRAWRGRAADRWDRAERGVMEGGAEKILIDAYRQLHGYGREDFSWYLTRKARRKGRRFDHVFCSPSLRLARCEYLHDLRARAQRPLGVGVGLRL